MLQALRERRCVEDAHENAWKKGAKIWVDAEVGSEACQVRNQAEAQNGNLIETILKTRQLKLRKPTIREPTVVSNPVRPRPPRRDLVSRSNRQLIPALLRHPRGWPTFILTRNHRNFGLLTSSTTNHWNQIFLSWTKQSITKSTRRAWEWAWDAFKFFWGKKGSFDMKKSSHWNVGIKRSSLSANVLAMRIRMKKILIMKRSWFQKRSRQRESSEWTKLQVQSASNKTQNPNCASQRN